MKIISFSLWGDNPEYCVGAIENVKLAKEVYPGWKCRFYVGYDVPRETTDALMATSADVIPMGKKNDAPYYGAFWRFIACEDIKVDVMISRDTDSRVNYRESAAVNAWLDSGKSFHTMHDHPAHYPVPIMAGMWGYSKCNGLEMNMVKGIYEWGDFKRKQCDQIFLGRKIWPIVKDDCLHHVGNCRRAVKRYGESESFPEHEPILHGGTFVGEQYNENNETVLR